MKIGEKLKRLRQNSKKTLREVSEILGVSLNSVYRWEHGMCAPKKKMVRIMAEHYDVPYEWLLSKGTYTYEEPTACDERNLGEEQSTERKIMEMYRKLSEGNRYKVLGYIERMYYAEESTEP